MATWQSPSQQQTRASNVRWMIFLLAAATSFINYLHRYAWGVIKPDLLEDTLLTKEQVGWLVGLFSLTYAIGQFPGGLAGDLFGPRTIIPLVAILWSCVVAGPAVVSGFWKLVIVRLLLGITQAAAYPSLGKVTQSWFPLSVRTSVQGFVSSFAGRAGGACSSLLIASLLMGVFGLSWQNALFSIAGLGILFAILFWLLFRNQPQEHPWVNEAESKAIQEGETPLPPGAKPRFNWSIENRINVGIFFTASFLSTFADNLFVYWMPTFLKEAKGFGNAEMGIFASLPLFGGALGGFCGGMLNDILIRKMGNRKQARRVVAASGKTIAAVLVCASLYFESGRAIMVVLFFCKFFSDMSQPTWWGTVTDLGGPASGRVFGMVNTIGSIGAFLAGPIMGYVAGYGWGTLFYFVGAIYILTALFWSRVDCTRRLVTAPEKMESS